ncbi:MAG: hypothetical protein JW982_08415 [Spirochaetes bacterium]|nr:hypothetical protein [Spirochaetota bacterium]
MKEELLNQYSHTWKMFFCMVSDFDDVSWTNTGCSYIIPARISYHIIGGVNYYIENEQPVELQSGKNNDWNWEKGEIENQPTREDIKDLIGKYKVWTEKWIQEMNFEDSNTKFEWTGENKISVVLFLLRHMEYHIGELNLLLNISRNGEANDNWIKAFDDIRV